jgi:hypothetical protein
MGFDGRERMAKEVFVANHHTGQMIFPRTLPSGVVTQITINPGCVEAIPDDLWSKLKESRVIQFYLDNGHLAVVKKNAKGFVSEERTSDPAIPEHLQEEEIPSAQVASSSAKVKRSKFNETGAQ